MAFKINKCLSLTIFPLFFVLSGCFNQTTFGIPHGAYYLLGKDGNIINEGSESAWVISNNQAEFRYMVFELIKEENNIYFKIERLKEGSMTEDECGIFLYKVFYDDKSKLLNVTMPSDENYPYYIPTRKLPLETFQFKINGWSFF